MLRPEGLSPSSHPAAVDATAAPLALIAGGGALPRMVAEACRAAGRPFVVVGLEGQADPADWPSDIPQRWCRLGAAGATGEALLAQGYRHICMAGHVKRPSLTSLWPDRRTARFLARVGAAALGDDGLLKAIIRELESAGFTVVAPHTLLADHGDARPGVQGMVQPDAQAWRDLKHAFHIAKGLGALDVGQGAVVQAGLVLAVEAIEGTDAMLGRCAGLARDGAGGVLVKVSKPNQDRRADLPAMGSGTLRAAKAAGLRGVGYEADGAILLDRPAMVAQADKLGLFLVGLTGDEPVPADGEEGADGAH